ncbi:TetR family transcriptional regulator [Amycolatopsis balhimycina DSM 5908]|uniref:TetR family transcriptional regulator n=2 Tax=Amycolatopsis balhimycina TaxID=208443 RepID=A0A428WQ76_AMYBA|nr:TetR family transcriptional regulator [Amycolatopsis balhimycina DSM 5908]
MSYALCMSTVKSRREQYSEATRAALLAAATRRFAEHGFAGTALEDIAGDIQATRGAIYHHFAGKGALFEAVFEQLETDSTALCAAAAARAAEPRSAAIAGLDAFLDRCCDPVYGRIVCLEAPIALGWLRWRAAEEQFAYGLVEQLIKALMAAGEIEDQPLETTTRLVFGMLGTAGMALAEASDVDKPRLKAEYAATIGRMVSVLRPASDEVAGHA